MMGRWGKRVRGLRGEKGGDVKTRKALLGRGETPGAVRITRRDFLKIGGTGLAGATLLGAVPGCGVFQQGGGQGGGTSAGGQNVFTLDLGADIPDMDSATTTDLNSARLLNNVNEGLYRLDENEEPQPAQAQSVDISGDKLTYTFTLRDGIKWSNSDPVTAQDFKYAWMRALNPDTGAQYAYIISTFIKGAAAYNAGDGSAEDVAIETPDDKTLKVTLEAPSPFWLGLTAFQTYFPQNQRFVEQQGDKYAQSADALLYNGPFTLTQFNPSSGATLVKNEDYWDKDNVDVQKVECGIVKDVATRVNLYEAGDLDFCELTSEYVDRYRDTPAFQTIIEWSTAWLVMNFKDEVFRNENIRRAIQLSFDRNALASKILNDGSVGAEGLVPTGIAGPGNQTFRKAAGPTMPEYNPQQAKQLWQQGAEELGREPSLTLLTQDTPASKDAGTFLQSQFKENLGANVEINQQPFDRFLELLTAGDFQMGLYLWIADYNDPMTFLDLYLSDSEFNDPNYQNARYDRLIKAAQAETDEQVRMDYLIEAERLLVEADAAIAPVWFQGVAVLIRPSFKNFEQHPTGTYEFKYLMVG
jgi:oligopeptide transport system substrate-binding protein